LNPVGAYCCLASMHVFPCNVSHSAFALAFRLQCCLNPLLRSSSPPPPPWFHLLRELSSCGLQPQGSRTSPLTPPTFPRPSCAHSCTAVPPLPPRLQQHAPPPKTHTALMSAPLLSSTTTSPTPHPSPLLLHLHKLLPHNSEETGPPTPATLPPLPPLLPPPHPPPPALWLNSMGPPPPLLPKLTLR